jgi:uncharacterized protein YciI/uncharacterized protein YndB with AHSA1/START domain
VTVPSVNKQIVVETSAERAFRVFTDKIDRWWPREHHIGYSPLVRMTIEPWVGGRWYSLHQDGSQTETGKVLVWEPPRRVVLSWQITADWKYDPNFTTEVEATFTPEAPNRTRVELEHRNLDRYGEGAFDLRAKIDAPGGWGKIIESFGKVAVAQKFLMTYESTPEGRAKALDYLPAHRARLADFHRRGLLLMTGPLSDGRALGVFTTKEAAEEFVAGDPFVANGVVSTWSILAWTEVLD